MFNEVIKVLREETMDIKKEINEHFKNCDVIEYYGDQIIDLDDKGVYLMSGFKIPYDLINRCGLDYSKHRTSDQASHIIRTLLDEQPVYKDGKKYELVEINGYPFYTVTLLVKNEEGFGYHSLCKEVYRFEDMASFSIFNAKKEIEEAFETKLIRYNGKVVVDVNDDYFMTIEDEMNIKSGKVKHGYDIDFNKVSMEPYDNMSHKDISILLALKQGESIFKDGREYKVIDIHYYPYNYVELTRLYDIDINNIITINFDDLETDIKVKFDELGGFSLEKEEQTMKNDVNMNMIIINEDRPTFKDVLYLMLKAEEEGKIASNLKSVELYNPTTFSLKYVLTNTNDQDKLIAQYKYIESLYSSDIVIESVEDIKQLREMDLSKVRSCHQEYDTDRVIALLESKLDDEFLTILLTGVTIKVEE